ncbi:uncharacterized protein [Coffea arabica]|uniref:Reverse transcriptase domain-containing protein n=1 Tax=Coffea arabica TaxID=13443 RepID=A0ABM4U636_COFAR
MRAMVWNCQSAGSPLTIPHLKEVNSLLSLNMIFLSETKNKTKYMEKVKRILNYDNCYVVEAMNRARDMYLMWNEETKVKDIKNLPFTIEVLIEDEKEKQEWKRIDSLKQQLMKEKSSKIEGRKERVAVLKNQLVGAYKEEEQYWRRRKRNKIGNLQREDGSWTKDDKEIAEEIARYYKHLFKATRTEGIEEVLEGIHVTVTDQINTNLTRPVEENEIKVTVFSMNPNKAPMPDGMTPLFFQKFWPTIKEDVVKAIKAFFQSGRMLKSLYHTIISHILKVDLPTDLKQYRPISLCLSSVLKNATRQGSISGLRISKHGLAITHLFFADDMLIFCKAVGAETRKLREILDYKNTKERDREESCEPLAGVKTVNQGKYLGLPMVITRTKGQVFAYIKDSIKAILHSWKNKFLSAAGKEVMLKAVTMAMPNYAMSYFKLPGTLCKEITGLMAKYWWGETEGKSKVHWCSWDRMMKAKMDGGLGFRNLQCFNKVLLGKQIWRMIRFLNLLVSKILKAKYYPKESMLNCKIPKNSFWFWQSVMSAREVVKGGVLKRVRAGKAIRI